MKNILPKSALVSVFLLSTFITKSCGKSLFAPVSKNDSTSSLRKDAIVAMNQKNFGEATKKMRVVWTREKSNSNASLFAAALSAEAGYPIFTIVLSALEKSSQNTGSNSNVTNDILNKLQDALGAPSNSEESESILLEAITVLKAAPDLDNSVIKLQSCIVGGFYALPALVEIDSITQNLKQSLAALPAQLGATNTTCNASPDTINTVTTNLSNNINEAASIAERVNSIQNVLGNCLPSTTQQAVNDLTQKISSLYTNADKGCSIPQDQIVQGVTLPTCVNSTISSTGGNTAAASDGKIDGCELFLHCTGPTKCF